MSAFEFSDAMNEITGVGGMEERACRAAVRAGAQWWLQHPNAHPVVDGSTDFPGLVFGMNEEGTALVAAIKATPFTRDDGSKVTLEECMTHAMYYVALHHIMFIGTFGWPSYVNMMTGPLKLYSDMPERLQ